MTSLNRLLTAFFTFVICLPAALFAADEQYKLSDSRIDTIKSIIARSVENREDLTNEAVIQAIYDRIEAEMPLTPTEPKVQIDMKELNAQAYVRAKKKFKIDPEKLRAQFVAEADAKYPMCTLRERVTVVYKRGRVSGTLYRINRNNILVNSTTISFIDMDKQTRSYFDAQFNKELKEQYVQERLQASNQEFVRYQQKVFEELLATANGENEKNGYIFLKRGEKWVSAKDVAVAELKPEIDRYKKHKEKQERARRRREAREKAEAEAKAASEQKANGAEGSDAQSGSAAANPNIPAPPVAPEEGKQAENVDPQDIFNTENPSNEPPTDDGGNFIALTPEQLAALSRPRVNETTYKILMEKIEKMQAEINSKYFGIDADQGFKKALWGFSATDVFYALSKETDSAFIKPSINIDYIIYPKGSRPQRIYLHYYFGQLYRVETFLGNLKQHEFNIYKNSLQQKYGESDTQRIMGDDVFLRLAEGTLQPENLPPYVEASPEETGMEKEEEAKANAAAAQNAPAEGGAPEAAAQQPQEGVKLFYFVWEGKLSRGVLSFHYDPQTKIYKNVVFEKIYLPLRLKKYEEKQAAASGEGGDGKAAPEQGKADSGKAEPEAGKADPGKAEPEKK